MSSLSDKQVDLQLEVLARIHYFSKPSKDELQAYQQSLNSVNNEDTDTNNVTEKTDHRSRSSVKGLKRLIPQVVRQTLFFAR